MAKKFEYKYVSMSEFKLMGQPVLTELNTLGQDGWLLIKWLQHDISTNKWGGLFVREENVP